MLRVALGGRFMSQLRPRATRTSPDLAESILLKSSLIHLHMPWRLLKSSAARFIELAEPDPDTGESGWVCFEDNLELQTRNGSEWSRGDVVRQGKSSWSVEKRRAGGKTNGKIVAMRCLGPAAASVDRYIPPKVVDELKGMPCVQTGTKLKVEMDHKNGRYSTPARVVADFQPLCRTSNLVKRGHCGKCKQTGLRFNATELGFAVPWLEGGEEFGDGDPGDESGCHGCYYHDIARFVEASPQELARASASELGGEAEVGIDAQAGRMRSIQYLGAKTKLLPQIMDSFDKVQTYSHRMARGAQYLTCAHFSHAGEGSSSPLQHHDRGCFLRFQRGHARCRGCRLSRPEL